MPFFPQDLQDFLDGSGEEGFIYFSMGSFLQGTGMPEEYRQAFVRAFGKLKQRVLWKYEEDEMPDRPLNVKTGKWLPQQDVLGHSKIK
jgi:glucuronosyltransferase